MDELDNRIDTSLTELSEQIQQSEKSREESNAKTDREIQNMQDKCNELFAMFTQSQDKFKQELVQVATNAEEASGSSNARFEEIGRAVAIAREAPPSPRTPAKDKSARDYDGYDNTIIRVNVDTAPRVPGQPPPKPTKAHHTEVQKAMQQCLDDAAVPNGWEISPKRSFHTIHHSTTWWRTGAPPRQTNLGHHSWQRCPNRQRME